MKRPAGGKGFHDRKALKEMGFVESVEHEITVMPERVGKGVGVVAIVILGFLIVVQAMSLLSQMMQ